jgi:hypothetical protein
MRTTIKIAIAGTGLAMGSIRGAPASHASSDAPWCAVINLGMGDARWDCRYRTFEDNSFSELLAIWSGGILSNVQTGTRSKYNGLSPGEYKNTDRSQSCRD